MNYNVFGISKKWYSRSKVTKELKNEKGRERKLEASDMTDVETGIFV